MAQKILVGKPFCNPARVVVVFAVTTAQQKEDLEFTIIALSQYSDTEMGLGLPNHNNRRGRPCAVGGGGWKRRIANA